MGKLHFQINFSDIKEFVKFFSLSNLKNEVSPNVQILIKYHIIHIQS
jgi:hypothetical protein